MHKGPVTVIATEYGTRLDDQPVLRLATVDDKSVTFDYDEADRFVTISRYASLDGSQLVALSDSKYDEYARPIALVHHMEPMAPFAEYTWRSEGGGNPVEVVHADAASRSGSKSGSGSGCGSGSGSGTTEPGWRLTMVTESGISLGQRMVDYSYSGSGSSWGEWGDDEEGAESSSQWHAHRLISQQSTSTRCLTKATSYTGGEGLTTGADTRTVSADGTASTAYSSESSGRSWSDGYTHTSDDTTQNTTQDDYDYQYDWSETYNGDGTTSTSETASNNASGSVAGSGTHDWSWSYEGSCGSGSGSGSSSGGGSGCGSNSGSSGTSSSNWSDSYDATVSYPGFYSGAYYSSYGYGSSGGYAGDEPLDYIGDDFSSSSSGYGGESGSGNGEGSQGDEGQPPFLEWELRGAFLEEWDELGEDLARENALREQMWEDADQLWEELDRINRSRGGPYDWGFDGDSRIDHWCQYLQPENRERLVRVLEEVAKAWAVPIGGEHCHRWVEDARQRIVALGTDFYENEDYSIKYAEWSFDPRLNDGWEEHAALMIEFTDGLIFYVDNGALGTGEYNVFLPRDIPKDRNWRESVNHGLDIDPPLEKVPLGLLRNAWERVKSLFR